MVIKRYLWVILLVLVCGSYSYTRGNSRPKDDDDGNADNNNYIEVNSNSNLSFTCDNPDDLEQLQTIPNAFTLRMKSKNSAAYIYTKITSYTAPRGASTSTVPLQVQYRSNSSGSPTNLVTKPVQLTYVDQLLFVQPKKSATMRFDYDLGLLPLGYEAPSGQYSFTILFTMTQP